MSFHKKYSIINKKGGTMRNKLARKLIKNYQDSNNGRPPKCRFYPTCSHYAMECYEKFNFVKASALTLWRLMRCNPLHKMAYDPVPLTKEEKKKLKEEKEALEMEKSAES